MSATEKIELKPIGFVKTKAIGKEVKDKGNVSEIIFREDLDRSFGWDRRFFTSICNILDA